MIVNFKDVHKSKIQYISYVFIPIKNTYINYNRMGVYESVIFHPSSILVIWFSQLLYNNYINNYNITKLDYSVPSNSTFNADVSAWITVS